MAQEKTEWRFQWNTRFDIILSNLILKHLDNTRRKTIIWPTVVSEFANELATLGFTKFVNFPSPDTCRNRWVKHLDKSGDATKPSKKRTKNLAGEAVSPDTSSRLLLTSKKTLFSRAKKHCDDLGSESIGSMDVDELFPYSAAPTRPLKRKRPLQTVETSVLQSPVAAAPPARLSIFGFSTYDTFRPSQPKAVDPGLDSLDDALMLLG